VIVLFGFRLAQKAYGAQLVVAHAGSEGRLDLIDRRPSSWMTVREKSLQAMVALSMCLRLPPQATAPSRRGATPPPPRCLAA
jgi:hypothetical protein